MYHTQLANLLKSRWGHSRTLDPKNALGLIKWVAKYSRTMSRVTGKGCKRLCPPISFMHDVVRPHANRILSTTRDRLAILIPGVLQQETEIEEDGLMMSTFSIDTMKVVANVVMTAFDTGYESFLCDVLCLVMDNTCELLVQHVESDIQNQKPVLRVEADVFDRIRSFYAAVLTDVNESGNQPVGGRHLCCMANNMYFCISQWRGILEDAADVFKDPDSLQMCEAKLEETVRAHPGRSSALGVSRSESILCGIFVWARWALNSPNRRFRAWAV